MSLVVTDSGPVHYLVLCEAIEIIPALYGRLMIPASVATELSHERTPLPVQNWMSHLPAWACIKRAENVVAHSSLELGEREAMALAIEAGASQLLVDDRLARRIAKERGIIVTGTVGILELAAERGLLDLPKTFQKLLQSNFRINADVILNALERDLDRKRRVADS